MSWQVKITIFAQACLLYAKLVAPGLSWWIVFIPAMAAIIIPAVIVGIRFYRL